MSYAESIDKKARSAVAALVSDPVVGAALANRCELGVFDRGGLEVSVEEVGPNTRFRMRSPVMRQQMAFEILTCDYATDFARLLQQPAEGPATKLSRQAEIAIE